MLPLITMETTAWIAKLRDSMSAVFLLCHFERMVTDEESYCKRHSMQMHTISSYRRLM